MHPLVEIFIALFIVISGVFGLVGSFGLIKLTDQMSRLHAPTKATTLGVGGVLIASMLHAAFSETQLSFHELLITLFLFLTAPITANFIAKMHLHKDVSPASLPSAGSDHGWAMHEVHDTDEDID